jgi:hypothetical protein
MLYIIIQSIYLGDFKAVKMSWLKSSVHIRNTTPIESSPKTTPQLSNRDQYLAVFSVCYFNVRIKSFM